MTPDGYRARLRSLGFKFIKNVTPEMDAYLFEGTIYSTQPVPEFLNEEEREAQIRHVMFIYGLEDVH